MTRRVKTEITDNMRAMNRALQEIEDGFEILKMGWTAGQTSEYDRHRSAMERCPDWHDLATGRLDQVDEERLQKKFHESVKARNEITDAIILKHDRAFL
jgi:hypothetical protein